MMIVRSLLVVVGLTAGLAGIGATHAGCCAKEHPNDQRGCQNCCNKWGSNQQKKQECITNCGKGFCPNEQRKK